MLANFLVA